MQKKILLIDDDVDLFVVLNGSISNSGYLLEQELDGQQGLNKALSGDYSLVIIDGNLPSVDGFEICRKLREDKKRIPILMLTSRIDEVDRILGIEFGADDYITKPFSIRELNARIKALFRRTDLSEDISEKNSNENIGCSLIEVGGLKINLETYEVFLGAKQLELSPIEFRLLTLLASYPGKVFSREELMDKVWKFAADHFQPTVTVTLSRLRAKLETEESPTVFIQTIRGAGYRFVNFQN